MSCNSCAKGFSLLRKEKGCPGCGFSFCSKCLDNKVFLPKLNCEAKVCSKCSKQKNETQIVHPPDAYYKRLAATESKSDGKKSDELGSSDGGAIVDDQILARLKKLKGDSYKMSKEEEIAKRLQGIKGPTSSTSDAEIQDRLAKLRGTPVIVNMPSVPVKDLRTEQEQADDLIKQYVEQTQIDTKYKDEFDSLIGDIESRMQKLKGSSVPSTELAGTSGSPQIENNASHIVESEDEDESVRKIVEKIKAESSIGEDMVKTTDELPFCEICNEDATMRCLGCQYLFCKRCFLDHKEDDDGCNRYELYQPPKGMNY